MDHIEEGTIHAWLDDALAPAEAARVEAHVRECAECAAAVAEARGLIAASTRILSALDDVPAGVVPRRVDDMRVTSSPSGAAIGMVAPATVTPTTAGATPARRRRPWWQRPQFAAAAGIAFVAVALSVVWQRAPQRTVSDFARETAAEPAMAPDAGPPASAPPSPTANVAPAAVPEAVPDATGATAPATSRESKAAAQAATGGAANVPARAKRATGNEALYDASARERSAADAAARVPPPAPGAPTTTMRKAAPPAPVASAQPAVADSLAARRKLALNPDDITRAEKSRVRGERDVQLQAVVTTGASVAMEGRRDFLSVEGIVGCYRLQRRVPALDAGVSELVELQATERGSHNGELLRDARLIGVEPTPGTEWRWSLSTRGDVSLVRVQGAAHARFPIALRLAAQTGETSVATRVTCPAR